ncbi:hypothetical protein A1O1_02297 [Capronia coronata CBS 617.96]|uniref:Uncharacterized protein n=1 Tax=Capronia coronata CBS 617.96 TaxID=1182541 RepID=W9ZHF8_9EURO|nr:uncharacterized protein A1O1_02297 [Capronia coronata CBS 617.96]EXJ93904.1 hypothetical protein A1O1_02297 [Capronia coronata CBS 617.96]
MGKAEVFDPGHSDRVTVVHANFNGTRILTASIDHRIKVWDRNVKTGERTLVDTFTAHDSDIRDAKFLHPTTGSHIASIGNDLKFQLWTEDVSQAPNSGRRFRRTATIQSTPRVPFVSLDLKTIDSVYTTLALIDRQGLLSIYEPTSPDDLREWTLVDVFNVCGTTPPGRGEETSFRVRWDQNPTLLAYVKSVSDDRNQLSLVVSALNEVKIYRSVVPNSNSSNSNSNNNSNSNHGGDVGSGSGSGSAINTGINTGDGASHRVMFYEAVRLPRHPALVRDVQWAPFSVRGTDRIATACKDGALRIFELGVADAPDGGKTDTFPSTSAENTMARSASSNLQQRHQPHQHQSSLTSAITGRGSHQGSSTTGSASGAGVGGGVGAAALAATPSRSTRTGHTFPFITTIQSSMSLPHAHSDAWSLSWDGQGQVLMSNGSDGVTKLWRKSVLGGQWLMFAGHEVLDPGGDEDTDGDEDGDGDRDSDL